MLSIMACFGCGTRFALVGAEPQTMENTSLIDTIARVDLVRELDPDGLGCKAPLESTTTRSCTLAEAIQGFYKYDGTEANTEDSVVLIVSNVAAVYAEKQARLLNELVAQIKLLNPTFDQSATFNSLKYRDDSIRLAAPDANGDEVLRTFLEDRASDVIRRVRFAQELTPKLEYQRQRRNRVQGRLIAASDAACDRYKRNLNGVYSDANFRFGAAATAAGGVGAIITGENAARALAGTAGIISGVRAEYNDAYFRNKVVELLTKAMDIVREKQLGEIKRRESLLLIDYTIEDAISDAITYNASCSLIAGLQETQESLQIVSDPGLKWLARAFGGSASNEAATNDLFKSLGEVVGTVQELEKANEDGLTGVPSTLPNSPGTDGTDTPQNDGS